MGNVVTNVTSPFSSSEYWESRYRTGGSSGAGSYGRLSQFKADVLNAFVREHSIDTIIEFGVGDGNNLSLFQVKKYIGYDVSDTVLEYTRKKFSNDPSKQFRNVSEYNNERCECSISLDVLYHLVEDTVFEDYMRRLFKASTEYVIIYASNMEQPSGREHVRHRKFTDWIEKNMPDWQLIQHIPNAYPYDKAFPQTTSFADFYIYKLNKLIRFPRISVYKKVIKQIIKRSFRYPWSLLKDLHTRQTNQICDNILHSVALQNSETLYHRTRSENLIFEQFYEKMYRESEQFKKDYFALVKDLDEDSIYEVQKIIGRIQAIQNNLADDIDIFSKEEKNSCVKLNRAGHIDQKYIVTLPGYGFVYGKYILPVCFFESSVFCFRHGIDMLSGSINIQGRDILDIGAYCGDSALILNDLMPRKIYSFEASTENFKLLQKTIELNNLANVEPVNCAVDKQSGSLTLQISGAGSGEHTVGESFVSTEVVQAVSIDDFCLGKDLDIALIKVDIEGNESKFLAGAQKTLRTYRPIILLSIYHSYQDFFHLKTCLESFQLDYRFRIIHPMNGKIIGETMLLCEPKAK